MSMNKDEALRCLQISKSKHSAGQTDAALKFARKSLALCETSEGKEWLAFLNKQESGPSTSTPSSKTPDTTGPRQRPAATSSSKKSEKEDAAASRPYTAEQVQGIKRIKACKAKGDLYAILELEKGCREVEIKKAYRKLALQFHPDKCGAPGTDEAFKAIGHAFAVLGDSDKRAKYDRFGIDSDSTRSGGGGGFGGSPFGGSPFESEISPEDIFNMFFGEMAGNGVRVHGFTAGPGFRTHSFRRPHMRQNQATPAQAQILQFIHLLPVIMLFILPLISSLFSGIFRGDPEPNFSFVRSSTYDFQRSTKPRDIPYYVNSRAWNKWRGGRSDAEPVRRYDRDVESEWHRNLQHLCAQEQELRRIRIAQAQGWFTVDEKRLKDAREMKTPNCDQLRTWKRY